MESLHCLKAPTHKICVNSKGEKSNFTVEKSGRHYLNYMVKVNVTSNGTNKNQAPPDGSPREEASIISVIFLAKRPNLNLAVRKLTNPDGGTSAK